MEKPYTICHILSSLNGKIAGPFMGTETVRVMSGEYARLRAKMEGDAWLYGTTTTKEFIGGRTPKLPKNARLIPDEDFVAEDHAQLYYVSIDALGEIGWESGTFSRSGCPDAHVIEVLTAKAPIEYRAYLREREISYIIAGEEELDFDLAKRKLFQLFSIKKLVVCGGGGIDWSMMEVGEIDELSLVIAPAADGEPDTPSVFVRMANVPEGSTVEFALKDVTRLGKDGVYLTFEVKKNG